MDRTPLSLLLVHNSEQPIPPVGYGAIETILWQYASRLRRRGHQVEILNRGGPRAIPAFLSQMARQRPDFVHVNAPSLIPWFAPIARAFGAKVVSTAHIGWTRPAASNDADLQRLLTLYGRSPYHIHLNEEHIGLLREIGAPTSVGRVLRNAVETEEFRFSPEPGNGKAVCVAKINRRKGQQEVARAVAGSGVHVDFVGQADTRSLETNANAHALGPWDRATLHNRLTDYSASVLFARAEGQALAVVEALAAGLSVVLSPAAAHNIDPALPFVHLVHTEGEIRPALERAIAENPRHRADARAYAVERFDYEKVLDEYVSLLLEWL